VARRGIKLQRNAMHFFGGANVSLGNICTPRLGVSSSCPPSGPGPHTYIYINI